VLADVAVTQFGESFRRAEDAAVDVFVSFADQPPL
jgi:hypothetical protein